MNPKDITKNAYNLNAKDWEERYSLNNYTHKYIEKPAMLKALGDIKGKSIICIGCGSGEEAKLLHDLGANVVGFDFSEELIKIAKEKYPEITFHIGDAEGFKLDQKFDIAYASFVAHYFPTYTKLLSNTSELLKENGLFIFSIVHPFKRAVKKLRMNGQKFTILGDSKDPEDSSKYEIYGDYGNSREVITNFGEDFKVVSYHTTISEQVRDIVNSDFRIVDMIEAQPIEEAKEEFKRKYEVDSKFPEVLIYLLQEEKQMVGGV